MDQTLRVKMYDLECYATVMEFIQGEDDRVAAYAVIPGQRIVECDFGTADDYPEPSDREVPVDSQLYTFLTKVYRKDG